MISNNRSVRKDLVILWRKNVREILRVNQITMECLAEKIGISRQALSAALNRKDYVLSGPIFLGSLFVLNDMLAREYYDTLYIAPSRRLYNEITHEYRESGMY